MSKQSIKKYCCYWNFFCERWIYLVFPNPSLHSHFPLETVMFSTTDSDPPIQRSVATVTGGEGVHDAASCNLMHRPEAQHAKSGEFVYLCSLCEINIITYCITQIILIIYDMKYWCTYVWLICIFDFHTQSMCHLEMWITSLCPLVSEIYMVWISQTRTDLLLAQDQLWWEGEQNKRGGWGRVCHVICVNEPQDVTAHHAVRHWNIYTYWLIYSLKTYDTCFKCWFQ